MTKRTNATKQIHSTREDWLMAAVAIMRPKFKAIDAELPEKIRASVSFPYGTRPTSSRGGVIGQHFPVGMSKDATHEVIVHPKLDDPCKVLGTLIHELCHAAAPAGCGHGREFKEIGEAIGLEGKPTSMGDGPEFNEKVAKPIIAEIGRYPHAALIASQKKQTTRLIKCECQSCGYIARVSSKWLDTIGAPLCPNPDCADGYDEDSGRGEQPEMAIIW